MKQPVLQFSLDLYEPEMARGPVTESRKEVGFKKANVFFDLRGLSIGARRMLNAMWFIAAHDPNVELYDIDYTYFKWLAKISSRDQQWMLDLITEAQQAAILVLDPEQPKANNEGFIRVPLLGPAGVKEGRIYFDLYRSIRRQLARPEQYAFYSLRLSHRLKTLFSVTLYDLLLRDSYRKGTDWFSIPDFLAMVGKEDTKIYESEGFRAIKRYILTPALAEINGKTNLTVDYETRSVGRKVTALRFLIEKKENFRQPEEITEESRKVFEILRDEFGLSKKNFDEITSNAEDWSEGRLMEAIELTRLRMAQGEVKSPGGLFMHLLREDVRFTPAERERLAKHQASELARIQSAEQVAKTIDASNAKVVTQANNYIALFSGLDTEGQHRLVEEFKESAQFGLARRLISDGQAVTAQSLLENVKLRGVFSSFLERAMAEQAKASV